MPQTLGQLHPIGIAAQVNIKQQQIGLCAVKTIQRIERIVADTGHLVPHLQGEHFESVGVDGFVFDDQNTHGRE